MNGEIKNWDDCYNIIKSSNYLSESRKNEAFKALNNLQSMLGEEWFKEPSIKNHPIFWDLRGIESDGNFVNIVTIGNAISALRKKKGFESLFWKLKNNKDYYSTFSELEIAYELSKKNISIEIGPKIKEKKPDIVFKHKGKEIFLEIKSLGRALNTLKADIAVSTLSSHGEIPIHPCGKVFKIMENSELEDAKEQVVRACKTAIETSSPQECYIPGKVKFYFVPEGLPNRANLYKDWIAKQRFFDYSSIEPKGGLMYPDDNVSQEKRILVRLSNIKTEKQLPIDKPGLVIFESRYFYFWNEKAINQYITFLEPKLEKFPNIIAIALQATSFGDRLEKDITQKSKAGQSFVTTYPYELVIKETLIIKNSKSKFDIKIGFLKNLFL